MEKIRMAVALPIFLFGIATAMVAAILGGEKFASIVIDAFKKGMERSL
jgi:hypothetical protein